MIHQLSTVEAQHWKTNRRFRLVIQKVLQSQSLLNAAFRQAELFRIGRSSATDHETCATWATWIHLGCCFKSCPGQRRRVGRGVVEYGPSRGSKIRGELVIFSIFGAPPYSHPIIDESHPPEYEISAETLPMCVFWEKTRDPEAIAIAII